MKILGLECSAGPASVAIIEDGKIIGSSFVNIKTTHSQTLMPMVASLLETTNTQLSSIDAIAIAAGPGSFTGIRIGISAVKGLAASSSIPCIAVSTLEAMAEAYVGQDCIVCTAMDARCNQVYNALFKIENGVITRLCEDRALMCSELCEELKTYAQNELPIIVTGDGAELFYNIAKDVARISLSPISTRYQNAVGVCLAAQKAYNNNQTLSPEQLLPVYLRLPQAERELKERNEKK